MVYFKKLNYIIFTHQGFTCVIGKPIIRNTISYKYPPNAYYLKRLSSMWSSLCMAKTISDKGTRWLIRNGASIKFWHDNWTSSIPLRNTNQGPLNRNENALTIREVWDHDRNWSLDKLSFVLPRSVLDTI